MAITHGVNISVGAAQAQPQLTSPAVVAIAGTGSGGSAILNTPTVVRSVAEATTRFGTGSLLNACKAIFSQAECIVIGSVQSGTTPANTVVAVQALEGAEPATGYRPDYIDAPGLTVNTPADNLVNVVATQLQTTADKLRAIAYVKASNHGASPAIAITNYTAWRAANTGTNLVPIPQDVTIVDGAGTLEVPGSALLLGLRARLDGERRFGYGRSISSKPVTGVSSVSPAYSFALDSPTQAQALSTALATIFVQDAGIWEAFGGWSNFAEDSGQRVEHALNIVNHIYRRANRIFKRVIDDSVTENFVDVVVETLQDYFTGLIAAGLLRDGTARPNAALNTPTNLRAGNVSLTADILIAGVARRINLNMTLG